MEGAVLLSAGCDDNELGAMPARPSARSRRVVVLAGACCSALLVGVHSASTGSVTVARLSALASAAGMRRIPSEAAAGISRGRRWSSKGSSSALSNNDEPLTWSTSDEYSRAAGAGSSTVGEGYPWKQGPIVEPHRVTTLVVENAAIADGTTTFAYEWRVEGGRVLSASGERVDAVFGEVGTFPLELNEFATSAGGTGFATASAPVDDEPGGDVVGSHPGIGPGGDGDVALVASASATASRRAARGTLHVRYVRREIRALSDVDRERFFAACHTVYTTPMGSASDDGGGIAAYGAAYKDIDYFVSLHNSLAGARECDHFHDGLGFLFAHAAFTLEFERNLQRVDAGVAVPYWDFTIDAHDVALAGGDVSVWRRSVVFGDDWFGEAAPANADRVVTRGRFARTPVQRDAWNISAPWPVGGHAVTNAWGLVRAPWNQNRVPFVTRGNETYGLALSDVPSCRDHFDALAETTFAKFGVDVQYNAHGTIHSLIGGVWGADLYGKLDSLGYRTLCSKNVAIEAFATQKNLWRSNQLECPSHCAADVPTSECKCTCPHLGVWLHQNWSRLILESEFPEFYDDKYATNKRGEDVTDDILRLMCNDADDLNPTIGDALESASPLDISFWPTHPTIDRLYQWRRINGFSNDTWLDDASRSVSFSPTGYCWGHNWDDVLVWSNLTAARPGPYTNGDLWDLFDPTRDNDVPYVYDSFSWPHCADEGYPITLLNSSITKDDDGIDHPTRQ